MRGEHDGVAVAVEATNELPEALAQLDVDAGGRLVEDDHRRPVHERLRDQHPAFHAAGERAHVGVRLGREVEVMHHLVDPGAVRAQTVVPRLDRERLAHGEKRIEDELLRHHAEQPPRGPVLADDVVSEHARDAFVRPRKPGEHADQRRLAGAVRPEQAEEFPARDLEIDAGERLEGAIALDESPDLDGCNHAAAVGGAGLGAGNQVGDGVEPGELRHRGRQILEPERASGRARLAEPRDCERDRGRVDLGDTGEIDHLGGGAILRRSSGEHAGDRVDGQIAVEEEAVAFAPRHGSGRWAGG